MSRIPSPTTARIEKFCPPAGSRTSPASRSRRNSALSAESARPASTPFTAKETEWALESCVKRRDSTSATLSARKIRHEASVTPTASTPAIRITATSRIAEIPRTGL